MLTAVIVNRAIGGGADKDFYSSVTRILYERGVEMKCEYPKQITNSELLIYGDGIRFVENCAKSIVNSDRGAAWWFEKRGRESFIYKNLRPDENLDTASIEALDADLRRVLGIWGIDLSDFTTDYAIENSDGTFFIQFIFDYKGKLIFDNKIDILVNEDGGISELFISYREIKGASIDKLMKVIPVYRVLLKNFYEEGLVISSINIGFMGQNTERENPFKESDEGAVWRIRLDDGTERFFEVTYGDEIYLYSQI
jgi:hypothetical protein